MDRICGWHKQLTSRALAGLGSIPSLTVYGPTDAARRTSLVAFNLAGRDPVGVAEALNRAGVESRAGCHCATLAHHALRLNPPASCRLSFYLYNTPDEIDRAVDAVATIAAGRQAARAGGKTMPALVSCPGCGVPAEIIERFGLPSTDGLVDHIVVHCAAGHHFRMAADRLPAQQPQAAATSPRLAASAQWLARPVRVLRDRTAGFTTAR